jgi:hypothetical protein
MSWNLMARLSYSIARGTTIVSMILGRTGGNLPIDMPAGALAAARNQVLAAGVGEKMTQTIANML